MQEIPIDAEEIKKGNIDVDGQAARADQRSPWGTAPHVSIAPATTPSAASKTHQCSRSPTAGADHRRPVVDMTELKAGTRSR